MSGPPPKETIWSDLNLLFTAHPNTKQLAKVKNLEAVKQSVKNIILTNFYERPFQPFVGGNVTAYLFENFGPDTAMEMQTNIEMALENYEPRAKVFSVQVKQMDDLNTIEINITFGVDTQPEPVDVTLFLERIR